MKTALDFARWLQGVDVGIIGEDVNIKSLYERWNGDHRCNHDPAALTSVEVLQCECGTIIATPEWQTCRHCGEDIERDDENGWIHSADGFAGCGDLPDEDPQDPTDPDAASLAEQRELYAEPAP